MHPGQGKLVPSSMGVTGVWIIENQLFLLTNRDGPLRFDHPIEVIVTIAPTGAQCAGIEIEHTAVKLDTTTDDLLALNRDGLLTVRFVGQPGEAGRLFLTTPRKIIQIELDRINSWRD